MSNYYLYDRLFKFTAEQGEISIHMIDWLLTNVLEFTSYEEMSIKALVEKDQHKCGMWDYAIF